MFCDGREHEVPPHTLASKAPRRSGWKEGPGYSYNFVFVHFPLAANPGPIPAGEPDVEPIRRLNHLPASLRGGALTIGNFDGVHRGHARIVDALLASARRIGGPAIVLTFDPHPAAVLRPHQTPPALTWLQRKVDLLASLGVDAVIAYPTDERFLELEPREFFDQMIAGTLGARALVEGTNFFFGRDRKGNTDTLVEFCGAAGLSLQLVDPVEHDGRIVSSSRIRESIASGRVEQAAAMLCEPYRIRGLVTRGAGRGRTLGYPTANLSEVDTLLPSEGIYAGRAYEGSAVWPAAISLGPNPTFDEAGLKVEIFLLDYEGDLYDRYIEVDFLARLRDIQRFDSVGQLIEQMDRDVAAVRRIADGAGV